MTKHAVAADIHQLLELGASKHRDGDHAAARQLYREVLDRDPENADALNLLGVVYGSEGRLFNAIESLEKAIRLRPSEPRFRNNLGNTYLLAKEPVAAVGQLKEATRLDPKYLDAWCNLGKAYEALDRISEAKVALRKAVRIDPRNRRARLSLAQLEARSGNEQAATEQFRAHLAQNPGDVRALAGVLLTTKVDPAFPELKAAEHVHALHAAKLSDAELSLLKHGLGKAYDDLGRHEEAIRLIIEGKKLERQPTDVPARLEWGARTRALFTREFFAERARFGLKSDKPVFIVGMPRSGTTLVEQIVASHPKAYGAGELPHLSRAATMLGAVDRSFHIQEQAVRELATERVAEIAEGYLARLTEGAGKAIRVSDKAPLNIRYLGPAALMFPESRVIHCRRNPIDTCVSIFMQKFSRGHTYSHDLATLAEFYREYVRMADHWRNALPLKVLEVDYESTVSDIEGQARRIIDFLGLKWDDACLSFQHTKRSVATASQWQVRQPVYTRSVERWRRYEAHIGPLIEGLSDLVGREKPASPE